MLAQGTRAFVINLDDKGHEGTHWVSARRVGQTLFYADPFGSVLSGYPPAELRGLGLKAVVNSVAWQRPETNLCGYYAYLFTKALDSLREDSTQKEMERALWRAIE